MELRQITLAQIKELVKVLRKLDISWVEAIVTRMKEFDNTVDADKIYSITNGKVTGQATLKIFAKTAMAYIRELNNETMEVVSEIEELVGTSRVRA